MGAHQICLSVETNGNEGKEQCRGRPNDGFIISSGEHAGSPLHHLHSYFVIADFCVDFAGMIL